MERPAFDYEIITPEGTAREGRTRGLRLPGVDGFFGILARHAPLLGALSAGTLEIVDDTGAKEELAIGEGFVEVDRACTRILTDFADPASVIDEDRARSAVERARERLKSRSKPGIDVARAEAALSRALARLKVIHRL